MHTQQIMQAQGELCRALRTEDNELIQQCRIALANAYMTEARKLERKARNILNQGGMD